MGGAALLTGGITSLFQVSSATAAAFNGNDPAIEATIPELQALLASGALTSQLLTRISIVLLSLTRSSLRSLKRIPTRSESPHGGTRNAEPDASEGLCTASQCW